MSNTTRPPEPGEVCECGRPASIVYVTERFGDVPHCGTQLGGQPATSPERARDR